jgi:predicted transcriptional regulator
VPELVRRHAARERVLAAVGEQLVGALEYGFENALVYVRGRVMEYVAANPGSTASDVANALRLNRNSVATRLTQLSSGATS